MAVCSVSQFVYLVLTQVSAQIWIIGKWVFVFQRALLLLCVLCTVFHYGKSTLRVSATKSFSILVIQASQFAFCNTVRRIACVLLALRKFGALSRFSSIHFLQWIACFCCAYFQKFLFQHNDRLVLPSKRNIDTGLFTDSPLIGHFFCLNFPLRRIWGYTIQLKEREFWCQGFFFWERKTLGVRREWFYGEINTNNRERYDSEHLPRPTFSLEGCKGKAISLSKETRMQAPRTSIECGPEIHYYWWLFLVLQIPISL